MNEVKITDAGPDDAIGITNVLYKTWLSTYPNKEKGITIDDIEDSYKDEFSDAKINNFKKLIRESHKNKKRLVAKVGDLVVGVCVVTKDEKNNYLRTLYVLPEFQGNGIGVMLWNEANKFLDQTKDTLVQVADYTENAINFYKKIGFVDTGNRIKNESSRFKSGAVITEMEMKKDKSL